MPNAWMLEYIPQLDDIATSRVEIAEGRAKAPMAPGIGIDWDWEAIAARTEDGSHSTHRAGG